MFSFVAAVFQNKGTTQNQESRYAIMDRLHSWFRARSLSGRNRASTKLVECGDGPLCIWCQSKKIKYECINCLRLGDRRGVCSAQCMKRV